jgi:membrane associated rhomboid family serine protease
MSGTGHRSSGVRNCLIGACLVGYAAQLVIGPAVVQWGAVYGPAIAAGELWRVVTGAFLHVGLLHLGFNLLALAVLGQIVGAVLGTQTRFAVLAAVSTLGASVGVLLVEYDQPTIGISGLVYGLLGAAAVLGKRVGGGWNAFGVMPWLVMNLALTFALAGISVGGHLGGLAAGSAAAWVLTPAGTERR